MGEAEERPECSLDPPDGGLGGGEGQGCGQERSRRGQRQLLRERGLEGLGREGGVTSLPFLEILHVLTAGLTWHSLVVFWGR